MGGKVSNTSPIFVDNIRLVFNSNNPQISLNNKTISLSCHFIREHVANDVVEVRKIDRKENYENQFTKALLRN